MLRLGDAEDEASVGRQVDGPGGHGALGDALAAGEEGRPHVHVGGEVLDVGHVAVLAEERATARPACPGSAASNW